MKMLVSISMTGLILCFVSHDVIADCSDFSGPRHLPAVIVTQAVAEASDQNVTIENYNLEGVTFDYIKRRWSVFYASKNLAIGDDFTVFIDDDNLEDIRFVGGL